MRMLAWFTAGFVSACLLCAVLYGVWILPVGAIVLAISGVLVALTKKWKALKRPFLLAFGCSLGLLWFGIYDSIFVLVPRIADGQTGFVTIEASDFSIDTDDGTSVEGYVSLAGKNYRAKAFLNEDVELKPGDLVSGTFYFRLTASGGKSDPTSHRAEGIFLLAYQKSDLEVDTVQEIPVRYYPAKFRHDLLNRLDSCLLGDIAAFSKALLLGDRTDVSYELNTAFKISGISHIIAVSGLHVSILFGLIYTLSLKRKQLACILGVATLLLFASVVGFTPSVTRACIMQTLMLLSMLINREYDRETALAFSVLVMLTVNPMTVISVSFQLSVGSMIGIFLFSERIRRHLSEKWNDFKRQKLLNKFKRWVIGSVSVTLSATIVTAPLVAYYFGCVSLIGIVTNLLVLWLISFIFGGLILLLLVSAISMSMASVIGYVVSVPISFVLITTRILSKIPLAAIYTVDIYSIIWFAGAYVLLAIFICEKKKQPLLLIACLFITLLLSQGFSWAEHTMDECRVTVLDVGQGQCILLQSKGRTFIVDCGGDDDKRSANLAAETLISCGIYRVDGIIVTHYDDDHAGGMQYLLTRIKTDKLILPNMKDESGVGSRLALLTDGTVLYVQEDISFSFDGTKLTVIGPISYNTSNESSLCVLFQSENCDILITGDREELGEMMLLHDYSLPKLELLVAGHHGASGATGEALLSATKPDVAFISVGENNRYGHPSEDVLERLNSFGCAVYRTDINGTLVFRR